MKLNIPGSSPGKRGRQQSRDVGDRKGFPETPRSQEKQKKLLFNRLKKTLEENLQKKQHFKLLKNQNDKYLDAFAVKDQQAQKHKTLNVNAKRELNFKILIFHKIKENLEKVDERERFQEKNIKGLVKFAKKLTVELEDYK